MLYSGWLERERDLIAYRRFPISGWDVWVLGMVMFMFPLPKSHRISCNINIVIAICSPALSCCSRPGPQKSSAICGCLFSLCFFIAEASVEEPDRICRRGEKYRNRQESNLARHLTMMEVKCVECKQVESMSYAAEIIEWVGDGSRSELLDARMCSKRDWIAAISKKEEVKTKRSLRTVMLSSGGFAAMRLNRANGGMEKRHH